MGKFRGTCPDFIAPVIPNFVLSDTISISSCERTVSILTKNLPISTARVDIIPIANEIAIMLF